MPCIGTAGNGSNIRTFSKRRLTYTWSVCAGRCATFGRRGYKSKRRCLDGSDPQRHTQIVFLTSFLKTAHVEAGRASGALSWYKGKLCFRKPAKPHDEGGMP